MSEDTRVRRRSDFLVAGKNNDKNSQQNQGLDKNNRSFLLRIAALTSLALILLSVMVYYFSAQQQLENTRLLAETFLTRTDRALYIWLEADINVVKDIAGDATIIQALSNPEDPTLRERARLSLKEIHNRRGYYSVISLTPVIPENTKLLTEKAGTPLEISNGSIYVDSVEGASVGINVLDFDYGQAILKNGKQTHIGAAKQNAIVGKPPIFVIGARVEKDGKLLGMVALGINLEYFSIKFVSNPGLGPNARFIIVDDRGDVVASSNSAKIMAGEQTEEIRSFITTAVLRPMQFRVSPIQLDSPREAMLKEVSRSPLATYETAWYLLLMKEKNEAFGDTLNVLGKIFVGITFFSVLIIFFIVFSLGSIFLRRLTEERQRTERANRELERISFTDPLTSLPNRRFLSLKLKELAKAQMLAIASFDVDGLKTVNDMLGHQHGDGLILRASKLLQRIAPEGALLFRIGGDEFIGFYPNSDEKSIALIGEKIDAGLIVDRASASEAPPLRISYGFALKRVAEDDISEILKRADDAMYRLKRINGESVRNELFARLHRDETPRSAALQEMLMHYAETYPDFEPYKKKSLLLVKYKDIGKISSDSYPGENRDGFDENTTNLFFAERGFRIASLFPQIYDIARFILRQYERWDGKGEISGQSGDLPMECRVVAVAECYLAALEATKIEVGDIPAAQDKAMQLLQQRAGGTLDPKVVERFIAML